MSSGAKKNARAVRAAVTIADITLAAEYELSTTKKKKRCPPNAVAVGVHHTRAGDVFRRWLWVWRSPPVEIYRGDILIHIHFFFQLIVFE